MNRERLMKVLLNPIISEKVTLASEESARYTFRVVPNADKREIRRAVELMFDVKVDRVQVLNVKGKRKHFKQRPGKRPSWRKAYVRLQLGYNIDFGGGA